jgi:tetraacyldisaccharide 4'-kinase
LNGRSIVVAAGIGRPEGFVGALAAAGARVRRAYLFSDHHPFRPRELAEIEAAADQLAADYVITTEKDAVRMKLAPRWRAARMQLEIDHAERWTKQLISVLAR